jgi:hypothetical protein
MIGQVTAITPSNARLTGTPKGTGSTGACHLSNATISFARGLFPVRRKWPQDVAQHPIPQRRFQSYQGFSCAPYLQRSTLTCNKSGGLLHLIRDKMAPKLEHGSASAFYHNKIRNIARIRAEIIASPNFPGPPRDS